MLLGYNFCKLHFPIELVLGTLILHINMGFTSISLVGYDLEAIGVGDIVVGIEHSSLGTKATLWLKIGDEGWK